MPLLRRLLCPSLMLLVLASACNGGAGNCPLVRNNCADIVTPPADLVPEDLDGFAETSAPDLGEPDVEDLADAVELTDLVESDEASDLALDEADEGPWDLVDLVDDEGPSPPDLFEEVDVEAVDDVPVEPEWGVPAFNEASCRGDDFVELVNLSDENIVPLAGWFLTDDPYDADKLWTIPGDLYIKPGGRLVIWRQTPEEVGFTFGLACGVDTIYLVDPQMEVVDSLALPIVMDGNSVGRLPDITGEWQETAYTPGEPNEPPIDLGEFFFNPFKVHAIDLGLSELSLAELEEEPRVYVPGTLNVAIDDVAQPELQVGIRLKGRAGSFRPLDKKSAWKVKINYSVSGQRFLGLKKLTINNMVQDKSAIHEVLAYTIFRAFGIPAPRVGYAWVRMNGDDYGFYALIESVDDILLSKYYVDTGHLYEGDYGTDVVPGEANEFEVDEGDEDEMMDLFALIDAAQAEDEEWVQSVLPVADLEQMVKDWVVEQYIGHWDGYAPTINNYFLHSDGEGYFTMLPWGVDQTFSQKRDFYQGKGHLFARCIALAECRAWYEAALIDLLPVLDSLALVTLAEDLAAHVEPWVEADPRKEYNMDQWSNNVQSTLNFLVDRREQAEELAFCLTDPEGDPDGDGHRCAMDCDEEDPLTYVGAPEICNDNIDQDCNGIADDGYDCPDCKEEIWHGHRYLFCPVPRPFAEAEAHCAEEGSALVKVNSPAENVWLLERLDEKGIPVPWLGLNDIAEEDVWVWGDGSEPLWLNWNSGEPNNAGGEDCVEMKSNGLWNDIKCSNDHPILCEDTCPPDLDEDGDGYGPCDLDCNDNDPLVYVGAVEICGDGIDQDCDGVPDQQPFCTGNILLTVDPPSADAAFYYCPTGMTWEAARAQCQLEGPGADLAWFLSEEEYLPVLAAFQAYAGNKTVWIGANDLDVEGEWVWADGTLLTYTDWNGNEPNDYGTGEDCGQIVTNGNWNDIPCTNKMGALCRMPVE